MARILIVGGGWRGRRLASEIAVEGHAVRISTRTEAGRGAIEATGAECWIGTPDRLATLRGALENVTILCWMLGSAVGTPEELGALFGTRLEFFMTQAIDTTVRGVLYESVGRKTPRELLEQGERTVRALAERNAIPVAFLDANPDEPEEWLKGARGAIESLLSGA
ncbi:MAG: hypothetical protein ABSG95_13580 [Solirubrobacteraceae bacterium]